MTDEELVKALRWKAGAYAKQAADRIEALTKERDEAMQLLQTLSNMNGDLSRDMSKTKLLLAKAVEALVSLVKQASTTSSRGAVTGPHWTHLTVAILKARALLAEIKGDSHE